MTQATIHLTKSITVRGRSLAATFLTAICGLLMCTTSVTNAAEPTFEQTKQALDQVMLKWIDAENHHDATALGLLLAEPFVATFDDNEPVTRADYLGGLTKGPADPTAKQEVRDDKVIIEGDTAVMVLLNSMQGTSKGNHYNLNLRATVTFVRRNGKWQALALHGTMLKAST